jgi:hypothetical protein
MIGLFHVLKQNGIDPAKFEAQMKAQHAGGHRHRHRRGVAQSGDSAQGQQPQPAAGASTNGPADPGLNVVG